MFAVNKDYEQRVRGGNEWHPQASVPLQDLH